MERDAFRHLTDTLRNVQPPWLSIVTRNARGELTLTILQADVLLVMSLPQSPLRCFGHQLIDFVWYLMFRDGHAAVLALRPRLSAMAGRSARPTNQRPRTCSQGNRADSAFEYNVS
jgi:hypothetical protein